MGKLIEERKKVAALLKQILDGALSPKDALEKWTTREDDPSINATKHAIEHFVDDEDIRMKDKNYEEQQLFQLRKFMERLTEGRSIDKREIGWFTPHHIGLNAIFKKVWMKIKGH